MRTRNLLCLLLCLATTGLVAAQTADPARLESEAEALQGEWKLPAALEKAKQAVAAAEALKPANAEMLVRSLNRLGEIQTDSMEFDAADASLKRARELAEKSLAKDSPVLADTYANLANNFVMRGTPADGLPLAKNVLAIRTRSLGPDHDDTALAHKLLGFVHYRLGQFEPALAAYRRSAAVHARKHGPDSLAVADSERGVADILKDQGKFEEAGALYQRVLDIQRRFLPPDDTELAMTMNSMAVLAANQGRMADAGPLFEQVLAIQEKGLPPDDPDLAITINNLGFVAEYLGDYDRAMRLYEQCLGKFERGLGLESIEAGSVLNNIAQLHGKMANFSRAEPLQRRALDIRIKALGPDHPAVAESINNLAYVQQQLGRFADAEAGYQKSLLIFEKALGPEHTRIAVGVNNLATLLLQQAQYEKAEPLARRALEIRRKALGPDHLDVAISLTNVAAAEAGQRRYEEAERDYRAAIAVYEKAAGADSPDLGVPLVNLSRMFLELNRLDAAEPLLQRAAAIQAKGFKDGHPGLALNQFYLGDLRVRQGRRAEARAAYQRALEMRLALLGPEHPDVAVSLDRLAELAWDDGQADEALSLSRRATGILRRRFVTGIGGRDEGSLSEQRSKRDIFLRHLDGLGRMQSAGGADAAAAAEGFEVSQLARASSVGKTVAQMAARFAAGTGDLARLVREQQDTRDRLVLIDKRLATLYSQPTEKRNAKLEADFLRLRSEVNEQLTALNAQISRQFPDYEALTSQAPVPASDIQALLRKDEALLVYTVAATQTHVWLVRPGRVSFRSLPLGSEELDRQVRFLRSKLVPDSEGRLPAMTPATSQRLYAGLFAPLESELGGVKRILVVAEGALQSLPFGVLGAGAEADSAQWLARRYAFAVLPSIGALRALRTLAHGSPAEEPFAGFGDPVLEGKPGEQRSLVSAQIFRTRSLGGLTNANDSVLADVDRLRQAPPLPETAVELRALARALKGSDDALFLGSDASESRVKNTDLRRYRYLAFATHGVMAGELGESIEPGLILTPPTTASIEDDGYLAASEVAQLALNADWVLLSACNTAAPDGSLGAEGLSGLAKAFFYAGSRSLLVSNWPVASEATQVLTTTTMRSYARSPKRGKAEALQAAMQSMMGSVQYAHPFFWASFSVVGD